jgi:hypothetical protein
MSAVTGTRLVPTQGSAAPATVAGPVTQVRVVRAEWTKLRALRSTWWCGLSAVVLIIGLGAAIAGSGTPYHVSAGNSAATGVSAALLGVLFAQLVIGVVGVLAFSGEYGTGMIRATLAVVPSRLPVLWAKLIVLAGLVLPVTLLCAVADFCLWESSAGSSKIRRTVESRDQMVSGDLLARRVSLLRGGSHGRPTARDQAPRPQMATQSGGASETERAAEPRGGVGADPGVSSGWVR